MRDKFLVFGAPHIGEQEILEVEDSLRSGWLGTGPKVSRFEKNFSIYKGVKESQVAAVNSCTAALHVSMIAAGLGPEDEVITTAMTFAGTVNAIIHSGATPVIADINPATLNIDPVDIEAKISHKTRAIVVVHMAGRPCDLEAVMSIAKKYNLVVIEDCAHAVESEYKGEKTGTIGDFGCFSFYATKNVSMGEGGLVIGRNEDQISRAKVLSLHGLSQDAWRRYSDVGHKHYYVTECGFKYNMMDLQAAIGIHQLERVEDNWKKRLKIWRRYQNALSGLPIITPLEPDNDMRHGHHLYTIMVDENECGMCRDDFLEAMVKQNIGVGVHYLSIPEHPYYQKRFGWNPEQYPNAMKVGSQTASLPLSPYLKEKDVCDVIEAVKNVFR